MSIYKYTYEQPSIQNYMTIYLALANPALANSALANSALASIVLAKLTLGNEA